MDKGKSGTSVVPEEMPVSEERNYIKSSDGAKGELLRNFNFENFIQEKGVPDDAMRVVGKRLLDNKYQKLPKLLDESINVYGIDGDSFYETKIKPDILSRYGGQVGQRRRKLSYYWTKELITNGHNYIEEKQLNYYVDGLYDSVISSVFVAGLDEGQQKDLISDLLKFYRKEKKYDGDTFDAGKIPFKDKGDYRERLHSLEKIFMLSNLNKVGAKELVENRRGAVIRNYLKKIRFYYEQIINCSKNLNISFQVPDDYKGINKFDDNIRNYFDSLPIGDKREKNVRKIIEIILEFQEEMKNMFNILAINPEKDEKGEFIKVLGKDLFFELKKIVEDIPYRYDDNFIEGIGLFDVKESDRKGLVNSRTADFFRKYVEKFKDNMGRFSDEFYLDLYKISYGNKEEKTASKENVNGENINIGETDNVEEKDKMREFICSELQNCDYYHLGSLISMIKLTSFWSVENRDMIYGALKLRNDLGYLSVIKNNYDFFADIVNKEEIFDSLKERLFRNDIIDNLDFFEGDVSPEKLREFKRDLIEKETLYSLLKEAE